MIEKPISGEPGQPVTTSADEIDKSRQLVKLPSSGEIYYKGVFEHGPDAIVILDRTTAAPIYYNNRAFQQLGYTPEEFASLRLSDIEAKESPDEIRAHLQKIARDGHGDFETLHRTKEGSIRYVRVFAQIIDIEGGQAVHCIWRDITESKMAEQALRESEEKFRLTFKASPDAININRMEDGLYVDINDGFTLLTGFTREDVIGKSSLHINVWTDLSDRQKLVQGLREKGLYRNLEAQFRRKDGSVGTGLMSARVISISGAAHIISVTHDISDRKRDEERLRAVQERFRELAELLPETIFEADLTGRLTFVNHTAFEQFRYTQQDFENGLDALDMVVPDDRARALDRISKVLAQTDFTLAQYTALRKDGTTFPALIKSTSVVRGGKPVGLRGIIIDITEKQMLEDKLRQAQKMEAIGTLAGGIAHDFNNILFPIIGYAEMLKEDLPDGSYSHSCVDGILEAALRARDLVRQILIYSRQSGVQVKPIKVQPIINEALKLLRSSIPKTIEVLQQIDPDCGPVMADPTQIHQIVLNLATNAFHAMEEKGGRLKVTLEQVRMDGGALEFPNLSAGPYARLKVTDTGIGITKALMSKIFDPYFTTKDKSKGTGLGLSVVQGIVQSSRGDVRVYSELGVGTEVHVYLPMIISEPKPTSANVSPAIEGGNERILLVDDEPAIVNVTQQTLERLGYRVTTRTSSVEALEAFKANPDRFDLIITDMTMPNLTGDRLALEIVKVRPGIPIIITTGFSERINPQIATAMGIRGFLMKPIVKSEMATMIRSVLDSTDSNK